MRYPDLTPLVPNTTKSGFLLFEKNVLYRSEDGGTTWHINTQGTGSSSSLVRINSNGDLLAESFHQYFLRKHGSSKWVLLNVPVGFSALDYEFHLADPSFIVAGGRFGTSAKSIMKSADGGKSWQIQKGPFVIVDRILTDPRNPKTIYSLGCLYSSRKSAVATSHDAGSTWVITRTGLSCLGLNFAADFQHSPDLYVTALEGIAKSGDQGKTWQRLSTIRADAAIKSLDITPTRLYALILDNQGIYSVYFSTDAGKNWQKGNNLPTTDTVFFIKADHTREGTVFIGGPGLFVSKDGGQNWSTFDTNGLPSDQSVSDFYVDPSNPADYWISAANGIYNYTN